ncbi:MAG: DNA polymerase IV [Rikenellaceae bacterium]|nr:DNA polymerase IV [Rikenellaceae bacterium]
MRKIIHIDMDAFYASIEQRDNPALRGLPVAVGHEGERGVVAAASYEARRYGVRSAMPSVRAARLCPGLVFVPARFDTYREVSSSIMDIFFEYTELVEPLALDEAFLDVTVNHYDNPSATAIAKEIREKIHRRTHLTASAGVSVNKFLAKIASDYRKPDGLFVVKPSAVEKFVEGLPVEKFYGVGRVTAEKMHRMGIRTGYDLKQFSREQLVRVFGKAGHAYYLYSRGVDDRPVNPERIRKSLGAENTFEKDTSDPREIRAELEAMGKKVWSRKSEKDFTGRTVTLKLKFSDFRIITRSRTLPSPVASQAEMMSTAYSLLEQVDLTGLPVRLAGITISNNDLAEFQEAVQLKFDFTGNFQ